VNVHASFEISPDPKDDPFCLCSEEGNADFIVTLNPKDSARTAQGKGHFTRSHAVASVAAAP
jgi:predicted nucleic acid-binding protein